MLSLTVTVILAATTFVLGIGAGAGGLSMATSANAGSDAATALSHAYEGCALLTKAGAALARDGKSMTLETAGKESGLYKDVDRDDVECVLVFLNAPEYVSTQLGRTRALDGTVTSSWGHFEASWNYHPDSGTNLLIRVVEPQR